MPLEEMWSNQGRSIYYRVSFPENTQEIVRQASYDVMAEFSKWLEASEESIFSLKTEKNCQCILRTA